MFSYSDIVSRSSQPVSPEKGGSRPEPPTSPKSPKMRSLTDITLLNMELTQIAKEPEGEREELLNNLRKRLPLKKTRICRHFVAGTCRRSAEKCAFAHGHEDQLVIPTNLRKFLGMGSADGPLQHCWDLLTTGTCAQASCCPFYHDKGVVCASAGAEQRAILSPSTTTAPSSDLLPGAWEAFLITLSEIRGQEAQHSERSLEPYTQLFVDGMFNGAKALTLDDVANSVSPLRMPSPGSSSGSSGDSCRTFASASSVSTQEGSESGSVHSGGNGARSVTHSEVSDRGADDVSLGCRLPIFAAFASGKSIVDVLSGIETMKIEAPHLPFPPCFSHVEAPQPAKKGKAPKPRKAGNSLHTESYNFGQKLSPWAHQSTQLPVKAPAAFPSIGSCPPAQWEVRSRMFDNPWNGTAASTLFSRW